MKKLIISLVGFFLIFSAFVGTSQAAPKEFVVGCNLTLSGPLASPGITVQRGADYAAEVINEKGFMVQGEKCILKLVYYDHKYVPAEAVLNFEKMLGQGIKFVVSQGSGVTVPLVEKMTAAKVLVLGIASGSHHLTNPKYPYTFRTGPFNEAAFALYPWLAKAYPQIKKAAHINPSDEAGITESETRIKCAKNVGFKNVVNEYFKRGAIDFYPVATKVIGAKPDLIDLGGTSGRDQGLLVKALRELGYKGMIAVAYTDPGAFVQVVGSDGAEGVILPNTVTEPTNPIQRELHDVYIKKFGPPLITMWYDLWDPLHMLVEAAEKANSFDPVKVAEALRTIRRNSVFGEMYVGLEAFYGLKCTFCRPIPIGIIKNGKATHLVNAPWPSDEEVRKLLAD